MNAQVETEKSIHRMSEIIELNKTLLQLWPPGSLKVVAQHFNCAAITYALITCKRVQEIVDEFPTLENGLTYIMLTQSGESDWAASFDIRALDNPFWYEVKDIKELRYSARAESPAIGIARAAALVVPMYLAERAARKEDF